MIPTLLLTWMCACPARASVPGSDRAEPASAVLAPTRTFLRANAVDADAPPDSSGAQFLPPIAPTPLELASARARVPGRRGGTGRYVGSMGMPWWGYVALGAGSALVGWGAGALYTTIAEHRDIHSSPSERNTYAWIVGVSTAVFTFALGVIIQRWVFTATHRPLPLAGQDEYASSAP